MCLPFVADNSRALFEALQQQLPAESIHIDFCPALVKGLQGDFSTAALVCNGPGQILLLCLLRQQESYTQLSPHLKLMYQRLLLVHGQVCSLCLCHVHAM